jgi:hypothetical protein
LHLNLLPCFRTNNGKLNTRHACLLEYLLQNQGFLSYLLQQDSRFYIAVEGGKTTAGDIEADMALAAE